MAEETEAKETLEADHAEAEAEAKAASDITNIDGVGPRTAEQLRQAGYDTIEKIAAMSDEEIPAVPGIGDKSAQKILLSARALKSTSCPAPWDISRSEPASGAGPFSGKARSCASLPARTAQ